MSSSILVVDDHRDTARVLATVFRRRGYEAACAYGGSEALEHIRRERPSMVILDVMMPGMSGIEVLREVRSDPRLTDLPVVMFSAAAEDPMRREALAAGAQAYLVKTRLELDQLEALVERYAGPPQGEQAA